MSAAERIDVLFSNEETEEVNFVEAKEIALYSQETSNDPFNPLAGKYKGIVNAANINQIFNVTGPNYKIIQHKEVYDQAVDTITNLGMRAKVKVVDINAGARMRLEIVFPDTQIRVGQSSDGDIITLQMALDNSYDASTGVRCTVEALRNNTRLVVPDDLAYFYGRHTAGLDINRIPGNIEEGVSRFQTRLKERWNQYQATSLDTSKVKDFLKELMEKKKVTEKIAQKYLQAILDRSSEGKNQWELNKIVAETLNQNGVSLETQDKGMRAMDNQINGHINKLR